MHSVKHTGHGFSFLSVKFYFVCFRNKKDVLGLCSILAGLYRLSSFIGKVCKLHCFSSYWEDCMIDCVMY